MKFRQGGLVAFALLVLLGAAFAYDTPLLMWSGENFFAGSDLRVNSGISQNDIQFILQKIAQLDVAQLPESVSNNVFASSVTPEVLLLFVEPSLRSDELSMYSKSFVNLKQAMLSSKSSVSIPFVKSASSHNDILANGLIDVSQRLSQMSKFLYIGTTSSDLYRTLSVANLLNFELITDATTFTQEHQIFNNGVIDVVIVELDSSSNNLEQKLKSDDEQIGQFQKIVMAVTSNYVALFTSERAGSPSIETSFSHADESRQVVLVGRSDENPPEWYDYFPAWFWTGFTFLIFFSFILISALLMICGIQTPKVFLSDKRSNKND